MELQHFVTATLVQIVRGVEEADKQLNQSKAIVNPLYTTEVTRFNEYNEPVDVQVPQHVTHKVDFDVAVFASEGTETKAGGGIKVFSVGAGAEGRKDSSSSSESRIKFVVPLILPYGSRE